MSTRTNQHSNLVTDYLQHVAGSDECAPYVHRWCITTALSAYLGRKFWIKFGAGRINANLYVKIIGPAGCRKSTGIRKVKKFLLNYSDYCTFAPEQTSKEKFVEDLATGNFNPQSTMASRTFEEELEYLDSMSDSSEVFIVADEFNDFIGYHNIPFCSMLGNLWDYEGIYRPSFKNSGTLQVTNPLVTLLGGNTHDAMVDAFPPHLIGQGFTSRIIFINAENSVKRIAWPKESSTKKNVTLLSWMEKIKQNCVGELKIPQLERDMLAQIYKEWKPLDDARLAHYSSRRHMQLLKLCLITAASRASNTLSSEDIIYANTLLTFAEQRMPAALGEFGRARTSAAAMRVMALLSQPVGRQMTIQELWASGVSQELDEYSKFGGILDNLRQAKKITSVPGTGKWYIAHQQETRTNKSFVNFSIIPELLTM